MPSPTIVFKSSTSPQCLSFVEMKHWRNLENPVCVELNTAKHAEAFGKLREWTG